MVYRELSSTQIKNLLGKSKSTISFIRIIGILALRDNHGLLWENDLFFSKNLNDAQIRGKLDFFGGKISKKDDFAIIPVAFNQQKDD